MDFRLLNLDGFPHRFLAVVGNDTQAQSVRDFLSVYGDYGKDHGLSAWQGEVYVGSDSLKDYSGEKPLYLLAYRETSNVNIPQLVNQFQVPVLMVTPMNGVIAKESQPSPKQLLNPVIYGFLENPTDQELFIAMMQVYWMTVAVKALQFGGMLVAGALAGK